MLAWFRRLMLELVGISVAEGIRYKDDVISLCQLLLSVTVTFVFKFMTNNLIYEIITY